MTKLAGSVYLAASPHKDTLKKMIERALASTGAKKPLVAISYAAVADNAGVRTMMKAWSTKLFWGAQTEVFQVAGEKTHMPTDEAKAILRDADAIFFSGGDPVLGAKILTKSGFDAWIRSARAAGKPCIGVSAGAIMLCARWAEWPDQPPPDAPFDGGSLIACTGVASNVVIDCHAEEDDWAELRLVDGMLKEEAKSTGAALPRRLGLASGTGIVVDAKGRIEPVGGDPFELH